LDHERLAEKTIEDLSGRKSAGGTAVALHASERPEKVDRRRATGAEISTDLIEASEEGVAASVDMALQPDDDAHRRGDADGGSAAHAQATNRFPDLLDGATVAVLQGGRQEGL